MGPQRGRFGTHFEVFFASAGFAKNDDSCMVLIGFHLVRGSLNGPKRGSKRVRKIDPDSVCVLERKVVPQGAQ